jgi:hypothetical protein
MWRGFVGRVAVHPQLEPTAPHRSHSTAAQLPGFQAASATVETRMNRHVRPGAMIFTGDEVRLTRFYQA